MTRGVDGNGAPLSDKPGYAGCFVFAIATYLSAPAFYEYDHVRNEYVQKESGVKRGDFVRVMIEIDAHAAVGRGKAGLYINPRGILFYELGEEIKGGGAPNPNTLGIEAPPKPATPPADAVPGVPGTPVPSAGAVPGTPAGSTENAGTAVPGQSAPGTVPGTPHTEFVKGPPGVPGQ